MYIHKHITCTYKHTIHIYTYKHNMFITHKHMQTYNTYEQTQFMYTNLATTHERRLMYNTHTLILVCTHTRKRSVFLAAVLLLYSSCLCLLVLAGHWLFRSKSVVWKPNKGCNTEAKNVLSLCFRVSRWFTLLLVLLSYLMLVCVALNVQFWKKKEQIKFVL